MKKNISIKSWKTGKVIYKCQAERLKDCVEEAVEKGISLSFADLRWSNMSGADMREADLWKDNMSEADMSKADMKNTNLHKSKTSLPGKSQKSILRR